jgi:hypothetical protein
VKVARVDLEQAKIDFTLCRGAAGHGAARPPGRRFAEPLSRADRPRGRASGRTTLRSRVCSPCTRPQSRRAGTP